MCCVAAVYCLVLCCVRNQTVKNNYGTITDTTIIPIIFVGFRFVRFGLVRLSYVTLGYVWFGFATFAFVTFGCLRFFPVSSRFSHCVTFHFVVLRFVPFSVMSFTAHNPAIPSDPTPP